MVDHTISAIESPQWRHALIANEASYVLGIDINEQLVKHLLDKGHNVMCVDATSDIFLGEYFDVIFMGDVIEHVSNLVALLQFAKRHLRDESGRIIITTPNPNFIDTILGTLKNSTSTNNFEHTCAIAPSHMNELCRRSGLRLINYYSRDVRAADKLVNRILKTLIPLGELYTSTFVYILGYE